MRLLLAIDGTPGASTAVDLVASIRWPADLVVDVVTVVSAGPPVAVAFAPVSVLHGNDDECDAHALATAREAVDRLGRHGIVAAARVLHGREADAIVGRAAETDASLIVCGSRGHGALRSTLLGSVSAEIVDRARCSVLVARHPAARVVVLATDGSEPALAAEQLVARLPFFARTPIDLVTVTDPWSGSRAEGRAELHRIAELHRATADRLRRCGRTVREVLLAGDPAAEIVAATRESRADLIVLGNHGRTGLDRLLLGSVTRNVLTHSQASVLVARESTVRTSTGHAVRVTPEPVVRSLFGSASCA